MTEFRYALRTLAASRGFTLIAVATLALGIGVNTAIFSVVNGVLLKPLPFDEPDRIVRVFSRTVSNSGSSLSAADFRDLQRENQSLAAIAGYRGLGFTLAAPGRDPVRVSGIFVTSEFFEVLAVSAEWGRTFSRAADASPAEPLVVLSRVTARDLYGDPARAVGERLRVDGTPHTVAGVLRPDLSWPERTRVWILSQKDVPPAPVNLEQGNNEREVQYFEVIARLKGDVGLQESARDLQRVSTLIQQRRVAGSARRDFDLVTLHEEIVGDVRFGLLVIQVAVGLVLLIACANVSSLTIARASGRARELAIRAAIGAGRWQLMRQLLIESAVLGITGGWVGLLLGAWLTGVLLRLLPVTVPRSQEIGLDGLVAAVTFAVALGTALLFGVMPAMQASRTDAATVLKRAGDRGATRAGSRAALVVGEVALTFVLLAGAGLLLNSLLRLQRVDSGLQRDNVTLVSLLVPQLRYPTAPSQVELYRRILEGLASRPDVQAAAVGFPGPLQGGSAAGPFQIDGRSGDSSERPYANFGTVSGGYFAAMGMPLLRGRTFAESDIADAPRVVIVNAALARKFWPGEEAVGKRLRFGNNADGPWTTVVGVVGDARQLGLSREPPPILYFPYQQFALPFTDVIVRSTAPLSAIAALVRQRVREIDPDLSADNARSLGDVLDRSLAQPRFRAFLVGAFAALALILASIGVFGLISYSVTQRTREVGIRMALGADAGQILTSIMRQGLTLTLAGVAVGLAGALAAARLIRTFLFGIEPADPVTLGGVALLLVAVAALATYLPSRRALRIQPTEALRTE